MEPSGQSKGNGGRKGSWRRIEKRGKSPVRNSLRNKTKPKPIEMRNLYTALNNMEPLANQNNHNLVQRRLARPKRHVTINALIDSGATEDFIDTGFYSKYNVRTTQAKKIQEVYLADG